MGTAVLGWIAIVVGLVALIGGIGGGIVKMFVEIKKGGAFGPGSLPTEFIKAMTKFTEALTKAPLWLALVIIGLVLLVWGGTMI